MSTKSKAQISIIGRPNVGKSTLINRLAGRRVCIVDDTPGVTRDRKNIDIDWDGFGFTAVDTGGLMFDEDIFSPEILEQAARGMDKSDGVIFVVDAVAGITKLDAEVADYLRKNINIPVYIAANKVDNNERESLIYDFYKLGFEKVYPISALHGSNGLGDMLDEITESLREKYKDETVETEEIKVAIVGKPNVGKSSLFNKLVGEERSIVSNVSGTTRDAIDTVLQRHDQSFRLIDTAGLRRKSKVFGDIERYANLRAIKAIEECDVTVLLIDATEEEIVTEQDKKIIDLLIDRGKACVVLINKWDIFEDKSAPDTLKKYKDRLNFVLSYLSWAPKEYISAHTGQRTDKVWDLIKQVNEQHKRRVSTSFLNKMIGEITILNPPPVVKQKALKIKYVSQVAVGPPTMTFFLNDAKLLPESYRRYLSRQLREYFGFEGTPLVLKFKNSSD